MLERMREQLHPYPTGPLDERSERSLGPSGHEPSSRLCWLDCSAPVSTSGLPSSQWLPTRVLGSVTAPCPDRSFGKQHYFEKHPPQETSPGERMLFSKKRKEAVSIALKGSGKSRNSSLDTSTQMSQVHVSGPHSFPNMVLTFV